MNNLEKYLDQVIEPKPIVYDSPAAIQEPPQPPTNVLESVRRRWYIVLAVTLVICAIGLPAVWFLVEPLYIITGSVHIAPVVRGVLGEPQTDEMGNYLQFVNTQAMLLTTDAQSLGKVVDDLVGRNLEFFSGRPRTRIESLIAKVIPRNATPGAGEILRQAIANEDISARYVPNTELLAVTMKDKNIEEAIVIVNSFLRNYVAQYGVDRTNIDNRDITELERHHSEIQKRVLEARSSIRTLVDEFGTTDLDPLREMEMSRQAMLMRELTTLEAQRIRSDADIGVLEKEPNAPISPEQLMQSRAAQINSDPMVEELSTNVVQLERDLIAMQQTRTVASPALAKQEAMLQAFRARLDERRKTVGDEFDSSLAAKMVEAGKQRLLAAKAQKAQTEAYIDEIRRALDEQKVMTQKVGATNLDIIDRQYRLQLDQDTLEQVNKRLQMLEMERDRRPRVQIASVAERKGDQDNRPKFAGLVVFAALACGVGLALLRDRTDKTLQTPADVSRHLDLPILGTTTSSRTVKPALFAEQIAGDYQTIRTNLGLLYNGGTPKRLVVSSAGMREGKTTFAVNLATSLAKAGKKVLLIDGDLRKPDIGHMLNILNNAGGVQNVLLGEDPGAIICVLPSSGLHVLAANPRHLGDSYELLTSSVAADQMERLSRDYDHLIVDSPPALAFPDALVWAKLSDAVILVSFAGQTTAPDLKEAKERFTRIHARILGAVLSNVPVDQGLYRYSYTYRARNAQAGRKGAKPKKLLLASSGQGESDRTTGA